MKNYSHNLLTLQRSPSHLHTKYWKRCHECGSSVMLRWFTDWAAAGVRLWCQTDNPDNLVGATKIFWMPWGIIKDKDPECQILGPQIQFSNQPLLWWSSSSQQHQWLTTISASHVPAIHTRPFLYFQERVSIITYRTNFHTQRSTGQNAFPEIVFIFLDEMKAYGALVGWKSNMFLTVIHVINSVFLELSIFKTKLRQFIFLWK